METAKPHSNWNDFSGSDVYRELKNILIEHQENLCCYCEIALKQNTDAHVDHLKEKHNYPREIFAFQNLLASCQYNDCCGHKKDKGYFDNMVSPLNSDCESRFTYTGRGNVIPSDEDDMAAQETIDLLGLNCKRLRDRRESIIRMLDCDAIDSDYFQQSLDNCFEWYDGFFTVIQYVAAKQIA